jgi:hypothetical protein
MKTGIVRSVDLCVLHLSDISFGSESRSLLWLNRCLIKTVSARSRSSRLIDSIISLLISLNQHFYVLSLHILSLHLSSTLSSFFIADVEKYSPIRSQRSIVAWHPSLINRANVLSEHYGHVTFERTSVQFQP